ncbi:hypothetical protein BHE74_00007598 [Ensete ventricosum]|nr:hypothetical protein BHE74_00007598 [Ensete ventricosum]RZR86810.1 hypothetical protein BHM03_00014072 [Ensete ventricosum]
MGHDIDNFPPFLLKEEAKQVMRLRGILYFKAVKSMSEDWLVEAGLSPAPRGMAHSTLKMVWSTLEKVESSLAEEQCYEYQVALAYFRVRSSKLAIEDDPYTTLWEDDNTPMEEEVPIDDSDLPIA